MQQTQNLHVREVVRLAPPSAVKAKLPMTETSNRTVVESRAVVQAILAKEDPRFLVIVGPCSIHDPKGASEYAQRLNALREQLADRVYLIMRVYFEKPRTTVGW